MTKEIHPNVLPAYVPDATMACKTWWLVIIMIWESFWIFRKVMVPHPKYYCSQFYVFQVWSGIWSLFFWLLFAVFFFVWHVTISFCKAELIWKICSSEKFGQLVVWAGTQICLANSEVGHCVTEEQCLEYSFL